jgi:DNA repair protein RadA/Sms
MPKNSSIFFCSSCGNEFSKWAGQCSACKEWNTLTETAPLLRGPKSKTRPTKVAITSAREQTNLGQSDIYSSHITELDRVLGGGLTPGGVYLMAGQPGIGKSTLLSQLALKQQGTVYYVCSEESPAQVAKRLERLDLPYDHIQLINSSSLDSIFNTLDNQTPALLIVDSIQSVYTDQNLTTPGSPSQVRDSANLVIKHTKSTALTTIIVGHVTKEGTIAGPKLLEHMVDVVIELTGDRSHELRLLHAVKNRFGPTDETGIFRMTGAGLEEVPDPSQILLEGRIAGAGSCITMITEGTRPMTVEIQALVVGSPIPIPRRIAKGISTARLQLICAILTKHTKIKLSDKDVYINVTGGLDIKDPGADLAIALAIISSAKDKTLPENHVCIGELGLLGEIRRVKLQDKILKEAKTLGYNHLISPTTHHHLRDIAI